MAIRSENGFYKVTKLDQSTSECSCYDHKTMSLPCRHIMFARAEINIDIFLPCMVPERKRLNYTINFLESNIKSKNLNKVIENLNK